MQSTWSSYVTPGLLAVVLILTARSNANEFVDIGSRRQLFVEVVIVNKLHEAIALRILLEIRTNCSCTDHVYPRSGLTPYQ